MLRMVIGASVLLALAAPAPAVAETCSGETVTISWRDRDFRGDIDGTNGRDVIQGGPGAERIDGGGGDDTICGGGGPDSIRGGSGRDELIGQGGNDSFDGPDLGEDVVSGGPNRQDRDSADYRESPVGVRVALAQGLVMADGASARGGILGIEIVHGSRHDDELVGDARAQQLIGWGGNDVVDGRAGDDDLYGGAGIDRVTYGWADAPLRADLGLDEANVRVGSGKNASTDDLVLVEIVVGTEHDDRITGGKADERLIGGPGDDIIKGRRGDDTLEGEGGDDTLFPGPGDDTVDGGPNGRVTSTGAPGDLVSYQGDTADIGGATSYDFEAYLGINGFLENPPQTRGVGDDLLLGVESVRAPKNAMSYLEGDDGPNVLIGSNRIDVLEGNGGNDLLFGLHSNDSLAGDAGDDFLDGGPPGGEGDSDKLDGGDGEDTCLNGFRIGCESATDD